MSSDVWATVTDQDSGKCPFAVQVTFNGKAVQTVRLEPDVTYIGRMPENHIVIDDPEASRSHARILYKDAQLVVEDQESANGVFVNERKIKKQQVVGKGDRIRIGSYQLEIIQASMEAKKVSREDQLDHAEEEEWRQDQTINISSIQLQKQYEEGLKKQEKEKKSAPPKVNINISVAGKTFSKEFTFDKGMARPAGEKGNILEVRLSLGKWLLVKKLPLE